MKRKLLLGILGTTVMMLSACGTKNETEADDYVMDDWVLIEDESVKQDTNNSNDEYRKIYEQIVEKEAYYSVLDKLYTTYTLPDGTDLSYDGILDLSDNCFAIYDIDYDGQEELIIIWDTTYTAGQSVIVYGYDSAAGTVRTELWQYPLQIFYDNGVVEVGLSHNQGLASMMPDHVDFWPYFLYQYDKSTDTYVQCALVDAWNKAYRATDYDGNAFPDDIDVDGDGVVYLIEVGENEEWMDAEAYKAWRDSYVGGANEVEIPFEKMTGEWRDSH